MNFGQSIIDFSLRRPVTITVVMVAATLALGLLAALPTVWPQGFSMLNALKVDTDPENMLPADEPVRLFHNAMKKEMSISDIVVVGIVNNKHPQGVFNPGSLARIRELADFAKGLRWEEERGGRTVTVGVKEIDMIAPSMVDVSEYKDDTIRFEWLADPTPTTDAEALEVRRKAMRIPFLEGTLVSDDGRAICLYLPLTSKDLSHQIYQKLNAKIATMTGDEQYYITGLPVAEDTFGVEMFMQMAISAPVAMLVIFILMMVFFRKFILVVSPMVVAVVSIICTMGLLVITGNTVHIMSSMIPIFIMPIAVLDAVHILSEFFDRYQETKDRRKTIVHVMNTLFTPMLYTSLTTAVGFASLALTPIPPVQIFGLFVAFGVMVAWVLTVTFIPAFVMFIPDRWLAGFGATHHGDEEGSKTLLSRVLRVVGITTYRHAKLILAAVLIVSAVAAYGITRININDNPIKWFVPSHPIRVADAELNKHFGGTYMAYLALEAPAETWSAQAFLPGMFERLSTKAAELKRDDYAGADEAASALRVEAERIAGTFSSKKEFLKALEEFANSKGDGLSAWNELALFVSAEGQRDEVFKQPEVLARIERLQAAMRMVLAGDGVTPLVGKSNSLADIVKTVRRDFVSGKDEDYTIPKNSAGVAQVLEQYMSSHRKDDLWHFVTPNYRKSVIWVQLKSGDNRDMEKVRKAVDTWVAANGLPMGTTHRWFGLTYINVVWQEKMVSGMLQAFLGSFLAVFLMMTLLYRSALWGLLSMIPLTVTIGLIYGAIGLAGKDYDMPVAVLSSLSLGLAVDYAIHFLSRSRSLHERYHTWKDTAGPVFGEPARAITRNVIVVGVGFLPLVLSSLVPYQTVGLLIAAILITAGVATLLILPAAMTLLELALFGKGQAVQLACKCGTCVASAAAAVALVAVNVHQFFAVGATSLAYVSVPAFLLLVGVCALASRREACRIKEKGGSQ